MNPLHLEHLSLPELLDLYYKIQSEILPSQLQELPTLNSRVAPQYKNRVYDSTSHQQKLRIVIANFLIETEKLIIQKILSLSNKRWVAMQAKYKEIPYHLYLKVVRRGGFEWVKHSFPVKYFTKINYQDVDYIATIDVSKLQGEMHKVILAAAQGSANFAAQKFKIKPINMSENPYATFYSQRIRKFTFAVQENLQTRVRHEVVEALRMGESREQLIRRIQKTFKQPVLVKVAPLKDRNGKIIRKGYSYQLSNKAWANAVAATEVSYATNNARLQELKASGVVATVRWLTVSGNPCPDCSLMNGRILTFAEAQELIPYHVHCYCTWEVASYKKPSDPLPTISEFSQDLYANPQGIGLMEMMKMTPAELIRFSEYLENNHWKEAQNMIMRQHLKHHEEILTANSILKSKVIGENLQGKELSLHWERLFTLSTLKPETFQGIVSVQLVKSSVISEEGKSFYGVCTTYKLKTPQSTIKLVYHRPQTLAHEVMHHVYNTKIEKSETLKSIVTQTKQKVLKDPVLKSKYLYHSSKDDGEFFATTGNYMISLVGREQLKQDLGEEYYNLLKPYFKEEL